MKISLKLTAALLAAVVLAFGCKTATSDDTPSVPTVKTVTAPTVTAAADLPSITGTTVPADDTAKVTLYSDSCSALNAAINAGMSSSLKALRSSRETYTDGDTIDTTITVGTGSIGVKGSYSITQTSIDNNTSLQGNTTYNDIMSIMLDMTLDGTINNITTNDGTYTYTINGVTKNQISEYANVDIITGSTEGSYTADLDFALGLGIGTAISVKRSDGAGAKFVITYGTNYLKNDIALDGLKESPFSAELAAYLGKQPATLTVYNDANEPVLTKTLPASDAYSSSILSNMGKD